MVFGALPHIDWQYQKELEEKHGKALAEGSCGPGLWSLRRCVPSGEEVSKCTVRAFEATEETFTCHRSVARAREPQHARKEDGGLRVGHRGTAGGWLFFFARGLTQMDLLV
ncbi:unnamed protein product [Effrenium voratum]|nr:unnamed protein product [Effrenium voratum]